ncbi:MAG: DUF1611 domain-containing protein [Haliscomenobacter sp.]|uniref:DUF1611 domain-containing protein n=1 Tax=Haliscomenobacter sp. TaxID=2717303 RepID=UPI0029B327D3|nr:DUF1611 domain-containing protein [Haliscomenobacter sp.]MDX2070777.1 DUF1611 domain-containing protein [Haliscomenobacter sp.]
MATGTAIVLSGGMLSEINAKTTHGLLRGSERFEILAVIDSNHAGKDAGEVMDGRHCNIPVYATIDEALQKVSVLPDFCIVGVATIGGVLPPSILDEIREALMHGISIINGLHDFLSERPDILKLSQANAAMLIDVRKPKRRAELHFWEGKIYQVTAPIVAVMGMDCATGKRTTARFLRDACRAKGKNAHMIYTGQTGWMQGGEYGFIFDSTLNDFISGELEHAIVSCWEETQADIIFLEGQSALRNPSGPCGPEFLISGNAKKVVLVVPIKREFYDDLPEWGRIPSVESEIALINAYGAEVVAVALNTQGATGEEIEQYKKEKEAALGIPVVAPLEEGVEGILAVLSI